VCLKRFLFRFWGQSQFLEIFFLQWLYTERYRPTYFSITVPSLSTFLHARACVTPTAVLANKTKMIVSWLVKSPAEVIVKLSAEEWRQIARQRDIQSSWSAATSTSLHNTRLVWKQRHITSTSCQSHLAKAALDPCGEIGTNYLIQRFLGPRKSPPQTGPRSVQPRLHREAARQTDRLTDKQTTLGIFDPNSPHSTPLNNTWCTERKASTHSLTHLLNIMNNFKIIFFG